MKIKCLYVDHATEEFAILNAAQALDLMFSNENDIEVMADPFNGTFYLDEDNRRIEFFRDNELVPFQEFYERLSCLNESKYANVTELFGEIEG